MVYEPTYSFFLLLKNKKIIDKVIIIDLNIMKNIFNFQNLSSHKPWYKANFFISEPVLFGTWDGVFTSCLINILGVVIFLRMGWIVVSFSGLFLKCFSQQQRQSLQYIELLFLYGMLWLYMQLYTFGLNIFCCHNQHNLHTGQVTGIFSPSIFAH